MGYTNFPNALFATLHTCGLLKTETYCYIAHHNAHIPLHCQKPLRCTSLNIHHTKKIFKIKCVDLNIICILCHILIIYKTNYSVSSNKLRCVSHVNMKSCSTETNKKTNFNAGRQQHTSRICFASVMGISKRRKLMTDTAFALHPIKTPETLCGNIS